MKDYSLTETKSDIKDDLKEGLISLKQDLYFCGEKHYQIGLMQRYILFL